MALLEKWNEKKKLISDDIHLIYQSLRKISYGKNPTKHVFVDSLLLHVQRKTDDIDSQISKFKSQMNELKCNDRDRNFIYFVLFHNQHWSLAILSKRDKQLNHYDSIPGSNEEEFELLKSRLISIGMINKKEYKFSNPDWFTQRGGWECGYFTVFVLWIVLFNNRLIEKQQLEKIQTETGLYNAIEDMIKLVDIYDDTPVDKPPQDQQDDSEIDEPKTINPVLVTEEEHKEEKVEKVHHKKKSKPVSGTESTHEKKKKSENTEEPEKKT